MDKAELKAKVCRAIDGNRERILELGRTILKNPELGFKEFKTSALVKEVFGSLGIPYEEGLAITGVKGRIRGRRPGPCIAVLGELDAVLCPAHPFADPITGAAHSCGHNTQIAAMLGAAFGLSTSDAIGELDGEAVFFAVPAEEFVELEYRESLRRKGLLTFLGGKQELILRGAFDDIDMAMMVHSQASSPDAVAYVNSTSSAFLGKTVAFTGREAHAGGSPHLGINALNAAMAALMCIHAQRETFCDEDGIRVHPIITKGGDLVNIVPADVRMETYVRGKSMEAVMEANKKVNRAIRGAAYAIGANVSIHEIPGYLPLSENPEMSALYARNLSGLVGEKNICSRPNTGGSTDMGDLSSLMPSIHPYMGGFSGTAHSSEFTIVNEEAAYIYPAKAMALTVVDLLYDGAKQAHEICKSFKPLYNRDEYVRFWQDAVSTYKEEHGDAPVH